MVPGAAFVWKRGPDTITWLAVTPSALYHADSRIPVARQAQDMGSKS